MLPWFPAPYLFIPRGLRYWQSPVITTSQPIELPPGFATVCVVTVGQGAAATSLTSGPGGSLRYRNAFPVDPAGDLLEAIIDASSSRVTIGTTIIARANAGGGASPAGNIGTGFNGGAGQTVVTQESRRGGGAGGYTSNGTTSTSDISRGGQGLDVFGRRLPGGGQRSNNTPAGEDFGGGGGNRYNSDGSRTLGAGGAGAVRLIAGPGRAFPNTLTEDM